MSVSVIIACGGASARMGENKLLAMLGGKSCIRRSVEAFAHIPEICEMIIVAPKELTEIYRNELTGLAVSFAESGETRTRSVANGVRLATGDYVMIHDGARPFITAEEISTCIEDAHTFGSSVLCTRSKDTVRVTDSVGTYSPDRDGVYIVRTPQTFLRADYLTALKKGGEYTDDAQLLEASGITPHITLGRYENIKLTTPDDLKAARALLGECNMKIGHGYDVHRLVKDRELILGGVKIPYEMGLLGHSDADVLAHAISDSLLGALALGDIGKHFPDSDPKYKGADSLMLLKQVASLVRDSGYRIENVDSTVLCQAPKLAPYIDVIRQKLALAMGIDVSAVSVKATTEEGLGFTGSGEGIAVHAVCLLSR